LVVDEASHEITQRCVEGGGPLDVAEVTGRGNDLEPAAADRLVYRARLLHRGDDVFIADDHQRRHVDRREQRCRVEARLHRLERPDDSIYGFGSDSGANAIDELRLLLTRALSDQPGDLS